MRTQVTFVSAILVLALGVVLLPGDAVRADERPAAKGVWVFDVRVVRVDTTKEGAEVPHPFQGMAGTTSSKTWPEALALLKKRGTTTLLMDQNVTTLANEKATAKADRTVPIMTLNFENKADQQKRASNVKTGCQLEVTPSKERLSYGLEVRWSARASKAENAPEQFVAAWQGSHPPLDGKTLVLHYREQVVRGVNTVAVEIYGLVSGRYVATK